MNRYTYSTSAAVTQHSSSDCYQFDQHLTVQNNYEVTNGGNATNSFSPEERSVNVELSEVQP